MRFRSRPQMIILALKRTGEGDEEGGKGEEEGVSDGGHGSERQSSISKVVIMSAAGVKLLTQASVCGKRWQRSW